MHRILTTANTAKTAYPYVLLAAFALFNCGYFFIQDYNDHYRLFARLVFPLGIFALLPGLRMIWRDTLFTALLVYMGYLLLSGLWSATLDWYRLGQKTTLCVYLLSFMAMIAYLRHWQAARFDRALQVCVVIAAVVAAYTMVAFYAREPFPETRLVGLGSLTNVNEFSVLYGVFCLLAMSYALRSSKLLLALPFLLAVAIFIVFAWFGQSRTALLALLVALAIQIALTGLQHSPTRIALAVITGALTFLLFASGSAMEMALSRGLGLRPEIWAAVWEQAKTAPLFGHGLVSQLSVTTSQRDFANAHSAYLQIFWEGGLVGLVLFIGLLGLALQRAWRSGREGQGYTLFCLFVFACLAMTTDLDTLIGRPREQWMLFWLPLGLLLSQSVAHPSADKLGSSAKPIDAVTAAAEPGARHGGR